MEKMYRSLITALFAAVAVSWLGAQTPPQPGVQTQPVSLHSSPNDPSSAPVALDTKTGNNGRTKDLRDTADAFRDAFEKLQSDNMGEVDKLMKDKRCNIVRVDGLLTRIKDALDLWNDAESKYWAVNAEIETANVERQQKSLANMQAEQQRAQDLVDITTKDREKLQRDLADLQKYPVRNQAIQDQMNQLIQDIKDSEARLNEAQKNYEEVTATVRNMQASMGARLIAIRENQRQVEAYGLDMKSFYEKTRAAAQEVCNLPTQQGRRPLPATKAPPR
jgi:chromosome segregation ATPase